MKYWIYLEDRGSRMRDH